MGAHPNVPSKGRQALDGGSAFAPDVPPPHALLGPEHGEMAPPGALFLRRSAMPAPALGWRLFEGIHSVEDQVIPKEIRHGREEKRSESKAEETKRRGEGSRGHARQQWGEQGEEGDSG